MSERPIAVGDLVQVVRWPACGCCLGNIGRVIESVSIEGDACTDCATGSRLPHSGNGVRVQDSVGVARIPIEWLKRIPPLDELEGERTDTPMKEPA